MPPKAAKKTSIWHKCEVCDATVASKDAKQHQEMNCPTSPIDWRHPFVSSEGVFHTTLKIDERVGDNLSADMADDLVFASRHVFDACKLAIGDRVLVGPLYDRGEAVVRRLWPIHDAPTPTHVAIREQSADSSWILTEDLKIYLKAFDCLPLVAETIHLQITDSLLSGNVEFREFLKFSQSGKVLSRKNRLKLSFFGKNLNLKVMDIDCSSPPNEDCQWFCINENTRWVFHNKKESEDKMHSPLVEEQIGGIDHIIGEVKYLMNIALHGKSHKSSGMKCTKSVLIYGPSGAGKSLLCKHLAQRSEANVVNIEGIEIYSKFFGETENSLKKIFDDALENSPSVIVIDDIHTMCSKKTSTSSEQEQRILSAIRNLLEKVHTTEKKIFILMATNDAQSIDSSLRRYGRIDYEVEIPVPDKIQRFDILLKVLSGLSHKLSGENIRELADNTHGFVGADIVNLTSHAMDRAMKNNKSEDDDAFISYSDVQWAFTLVKPSAMKEILIDIPDVKWTDIGGQEQLKLKLKQSIEWPLKHEECFKRFGIKPPSGILMYGPPGCSKTMIAKALANESGLNFISIKGPELFSKWVGDSEKAVREVFRKARRVAPSIIFFDEIDVLGGERSKSNSGSNVHERVLAQILTELDGITPLGNVTIVAATNRPDKIDSALLRPGRLDRIIYVPLPDESTRLSIFEIKLSRMPLSDDVCIKTLVEMTERYSGAEIQAVCHEAALKALEEDIDSTVACWHHFEAALKLVPARTPDYLLEIYEKFNKAL